MREINYICGCQLKEEWLDFCPLHFAIFDMTKEELKKGLNQERYSQLVHALNSEEQDRRQSSCCNSR